MAVATLIQGTQRLNLTTIQQRMAGLESRQPEGTQMRLILNLNLPQDAFIKYVNPASHFASAINLVLAAKGVPTWPGKSTWAVAITENEIQIDWVKAGIFVEIILSAVLGALAYYAITHWSLQKIYTPSTASGGSTSNPPSVLGDVRLIAYAVIGFGLFAFLTQVAKYREDVVTSHGY